LRERTLAASSRNNFAWGALIVIGITAFTLQWLMDERPPRERKRAGPLEPAVA